MIRVAIVAESPRLRSEMLDVLREAGRFEVVANVPAVNDDFGASREGAALDAADVILTDAVMSAGAGIKTADAAAAALVLLADEDELLGTLRPFRTGFALLPTTATGEQIVAAIEGAA